MGAKAQMSANQLLQMLVVGSAAGNAQRCRPVMSNHYDMQAPSLKAASAVISPARQGRVLVATSGSLAIATAIAWANSTAAMTGSHTAYRGEESCRTALLYVHYCVSHTVNHSFCWYASSAQRDAASAQGPAPAAAGSVFACTSLLSQHLLLLVYDFSWHAPGKHILPDPIATCCPVQGCQVLTAQPDHYSRGSTHSRPLCAPG